LILILTYWLLVTALRQLRAVDERESAFSGCFDFGVLVVLGSVGVLAMEEGMPNPHLP